jgi:hypothetical protein
MSMDKVRYPDAIPTRGVSSQLPLVGKMIGEVPEKAMGGGWVSISGDTERAKRLRDRLAQLKIGTGGTQFAANGGPGGATDTLIGLTDGRISRVVLVFGAKMSWSDAERKLRDFTVASVSAEGGRGMQKYWGTIEKDNAKYYGRVIGYWEDNKDGAVKKHYNSNGSVTGTQVAAEHQDGPTGIVIDVDAFSWGLANYVAPEHVDTVRNHKLATGLTETEARVAMYGKESQSTQENGVTKIKFYQPPPPDAVGTGPRQHRGPQGARNDAAAAGGGGGGGWGGGGGGWWGWSRTRRRGRRIFVSTGSAWAESRRAEHRCRRGAPEWWLRRRGQDPRHRLRQRLQVFRRCRKRRRKSNARRHRDCEGWRGDAGELTRRSRCIGHDAKPNGIPAKIRTKRIPRRRAAEPRTSSPRSAARDVHRSARRRSHHWIGHCFRRVGRKHILAPFPDVSVHVVQAIRVRFERADLVSCAVGSS